MKCKICDNQIPDGRVKALPNVKTCVACSDTNKVAGFQLITGKTEYVDMQIVDQKNYNNLTRLQYRKNYGARY